MTEIYEKVEIIKSLINDCDCILIGAGAGLSIAAGLDNKGLKFEERFKDFVDAYGIKDFYSGGFYPFKTKEEKWAFFARYFVTYLDHESTKLYENILKLVQNKDYFIITTNVDGNFEKSGFNPDKIFEMQGDFISIQCPTPCHNKVYESIDLFREMVKKTENRKIPTELLPKCPKCGEIMRTHLRENSAFVEDDRWHQQNKAYLNFIKKNKNKKMILLEMGVGFNTPTIIRFPFEEKTINNKKWNLIRFNKEYSGLIAHTTRGIDVINDWEIIKSLKLKNDFQQRFIPISEDTNEIINKLL
ncbi:hypothetical protein PIROE2DRAFT_18648 [Piromyces sp. E2]|nr:hypothetical protein PIROE2DRAFT_18648 [Piromyces sp. E2]|eukprot:OUM56642.1 hypothetical protein PIROE2DRAFT_18648 [Piromyces sp. E2]